MRSRSPAPDVVEVARRRLDQLAAELAVARGERPPARELSDDEWLAALAAPADPWPQDDPPPEADPSPALRHHDAPAPAGDTGRAVAPGPGGESGPTGRHARRPVGPLTRCWGWVRDRLPPGLQGRVQLGASHLAVVALVVAAALTVTAWWVTRSGGAGTAVAERPSVTAPSVAPVTGPVGSTTTGPAGATTPGPVTGAATGAAASPTPAGGVVVVDVAGKVRKPGIVTLPAGARVVDALEAAGGPRRGVGTRGLNLARILVDGEQVVVGLPAAGGPAAAAVGSPAAGASPGGPVGLVNINTADQATLETLPGVGPVTAQAILAWRTENGPFTSVDELLEVSGIGDATLAEIAPHATL